MRNVSIGYYQGFNKLVQVFLESTEYKEKESFYLMINLFENILPQNFIIFFLQTEVYLLKYLVEKYEPFLIEYYNNNEDTIVSLLSYFIIICFVDFPELNHFFICLFFLFSLFENKNDIFFCYYLKILLFTIKIIKPILIRQDDRNIYELIKNELKKKEIIESIIYYTLFEEIDFDYIKNLRETEIKKAIKNPDIMYNSKDYPEIDCNKYFPLCVKECGIEIDRSEYLNFKINHQSGVCANDSNNKNDKEYDILKDIIIERRKHFCEIEKNKGNEKNEN